MAQFADYRNIVSIETIETGKLIIKLLNETTLITGERINFVGGTSVGDALYQLKSSLIWTPKLHVSRDELKKKWEISMSLKEIATMVREQKHGGTLLLVSNSSNWITESAKTPILFSGLPYRKVKDLMKNYIEKRAKHSDSYSFYPVPYEIRDSYKGLQESLKHIAQFMAVDGAVVVNEDLEMLAFGVKIKPKSSKNSPNEILMVEPFEGNQVNPISLADLGGTRHQSAAQFVFDQNDAVALVVSQDGNISLFGWNAEKEKVMVIRNYDLFYNFS